MDSSMILDVLVWAASLLLY